DRVATADEAHARSFEREARRAVGAEVLIDTRARVVVARAHAEPRRSRAAVAGRARRHADERARAVAVGDAVTAAAGAARDDDERNEADAQMHARDLPRRSTRWSFGSMSRRG